MLSDCYSPEGEPRSYLLITNKLSLDIRDDGVVLTVSFPSTQARAAFWASVASEAAGALEAEAL